MIKAQLVLMLLVGVLTGCNKPNVLKEFVVPVYHNQLKPICIHANKLIYHPQSLQISREMLNMLDIHPMKQINQWAQQNLIFDLHVASSLVITKICMYQVAVGVYFMSLQVQLDKKIFQTSLSVTVNAKSRYYQKKILLYNGFEKLLTTIYYDLLKVGRV